MHNIDLFLMFSLLNLKARNDIFSISPFFFTESKAGYFIQIFSFGIKCQALLPVENKKNTTGLTSANVAWRNIKI